jgi:hypothetical protein
MLRGADHIENTSTILLCGACLPSHCLAMIWSNLLQYKSPGGDQILEELIQAGGGTYNVRSISSLILFGMRKNCLISGRSLLLCQFTRKPIKLTAVIIMGYHCYQLHMKLLRIVSLGFNVIDQLLIRCLAFVRFWRENGSTMTVHQLFVDFKKAYDSVRTEVLYNILIEFGVSMKLLRLTKMCLN